MGNDESRRVNDGGSEGGYLAPAPEEERKGS